MSQQLEVTYLVEKAEACKQIEQQQAQLRIELEEGHAKAMAEIQDQH